MDSKGLTEHSKPTPVELSREVKRLWVLSIHDRALASESGS